MSTRIYPDSEVCRCNRRGSVQETELSPDSGAYSTSLCACRRNLPRRKYVNISMHRWIMDAPQGMDVDHINGDRLDNRRSNLRIVTRSQNLTNRRGPMPASTSGIRGVTYDKSRGLWMAHVKLGGRRVFCKRFATKEDAAIAVAAERDRLGFLTGAER